jgi:hypothetical protein
MDQNEWMNDFFVGNLLLLNLQPICFFAPIENVNTAGAFCSADNNHKRKEEETKKLQMSFFYSPISSLFHSTKD